MPLLSFTEWPEKQAAQADLGLQCFIWHYCPKFWDFMVKRKVPDAYSGDPISSLSQLRLSPITAYLKEKL